MKIIKSNKFNDKLKNILQYIASDSVANAKDFKSELDFKIKELVSFPFKFRASKYYDEENARDLIFKGYTIPYYVDIQNETIVILTIFKYNLP